MIVIMIVIVIAIDVQVIQNIFGVDIIVIIAL